jgi:hypothetical protein
MRSLYPVLALSLAVISPVAQAASAAPADAYLKTLPPVTPPVLSVTLKFLGFTA